MYEKVFESTKLVVLGSNEGIGGLIYIKSWDACFCMCWNWARHFKDGTFVRFGQPTGTSALVSRVGGTLAHQVAGNLYGCSEINGLVDYIQHLNPNWGLGYADAMSAMLVDDANRLWIGGYHNTLTIKNLDSGAVVKVVPTHFSNADWINYIGWSADGQLCCIACNTGKVEFFDYLTYESLGTGRIDPCLLASYDCTNNVIVSLGSDFKTRVYVLAAWPAALGNPVFSPSTVKGLQGNTVSVRLTGQDGEPCPGWWVHWILAAAPGPSGPFGWLKTYQSKTDANGYAWNVYYGPDSGETGQTIIQTSVVLY